MSVMCNQHVTKCLYCGKFEKDTLHLPINTFSQQPHTTQTKHSSTTYNATHNTKNIWKIYTSLKPGMANGLLMKIQPPLPLSKIVMVDTLAIIQTPHHWSPRIVGSERSQYHCFWWQNRWDCHWELLLLNIESKQRRWSLILFGELQEPCCLRVGGLQDWRGLALPKIHWKADLVLVSVTCDCYGGVCASYYIFICGNCSGSCTSSPPAMATGSPTLISLSFVPLVAVTLHLHQKHSLAHLPSPLLVPPSEIFSFKQWNWKSNHTIIRIKYETKC